MTPVKQQQEILFLTGTRFAMKELASNNAAGNSLASNADKLERAFWNGILFELLPELKQAGNDKLFMWRISNYANSLALRLGVVPEPLDSYYSIDPYLFYEAVFNN